MANMTLLGVDKAVADLEREKRCSEEVQKVLARYNCGIAAVPDLKYVKTSSDDMVWALSAKIVIQTL